MGKSFEQLFLLEILVERITLRRHLLEKYYKDQNDARIPLSVKVIFSDFPSLEINQEDFKKQEFLDAASVGDFSSGKSCLFPMEPVELVRVIQQSPMVFSLQRIIPGTCPAETLGKTEVFLTQDMCKAIRKAMTSKKDLPISSTLQDSYNLRDKKEQDVGFITLFIRLSCFGQSIVTQFKLVNETNSYLFRNSKDESGAFECETCECHPPGENNDTEETADDDFVDVPFGIPGKDRNAEKSPCGCGPEKKSDSKSCDCPPESLKPPDITWCDAEDCESRGLSREAADRAARPKPLEVTGAPCIPCDRCKRLSMAEDDGDSSPCSSCCGQQNKVSDSSPCGKCGQQDNIGDSPPCGKCGQQDNIGDSPPCGICGQQNKQASGCCQQKSQQNSSGCGQQKPQNKSSGCCQPKPQNNKSSGCGQQKQQNVCSHCQQAKSPSCAPCAPCEAKSTSKIPCATCRGESKPPSNDRCCCNQTSKSSTKISPCERCCQPKIPSCAPAAKKKTTPCHRCSSEDPSCPPPPCFSPPPPPPPCCPPQPCCSPSPCCPPPPRPAGGRPKMQPLISYNESEPRSACPPKPAECPGERKMNKQNGCSCGGDDYDDDDDDDDDDDYCECCCGSDVPRPPPFSERAEDDIVPVMPMVCCQENICDPDYDEKQCPAEVQQKSEKWKEMLSTCDCAHDEEEEVYPPTRYDTTSALSAAAKPRVDPETIIEKHVAPRYDMTGALSVVKGPPIRYDTTSALSPAYRGGAPGLEFLTPEYQMNLQLRGSLSTPGLMESTQQDAAFKMDAMGEALSEGMIFSKPKKKRKRLRPRKDRRFEYKWGDGYPGVKVGHRYCIDTSLDGGVPKRMGWLWYPSLLNDGLKVRSSWRPGAIVKTVAKMMREIKKAAGYDEEAILAAQRKAKEPPPPEKPELPPTLHIHRRDGAYYISMHPINLLPEDNNVPLQFRIPAKKKEEGEEEDECSCADSSSSSELEIEFMAPGAFWPPLDQRKPPSPVNTPVAKPEAPQGKGKGKGKKGAGGADVDPEKLKATDWDKDDQPTAVGKKRPR